MNQTDALADLFAHHLTFTTPSTEQPPCPTTTMYPTGSSSTHHLQPHAYTTTNHNDIAPQPLSIPRNDFRTASSSPFSSQSSTTTFPPPPATGPFLHQPPLPKPTAPDPFTHSSIALGSSYEDIIPVPMPTAPSSGHRTTILPPTPSPASDTQPPQQPLLREFRAYHRLLAANGDAGIGVAGQPQKQELLGDEDVLMGEG